MMVSAELHPIILIKDPINLQYALRGIFRVYRWLYEEAKILHRDISISNLMYRWVDGRICGVLNDFDLTIQRSAPASPSSHDPPPVHLYRHDLESLYYVLVSIVCPLSPSVQGWHSLEGCLLEDSKRSFFGRGCPSPSTTFQAFYAWLLVLHRAFRDGLNAQSRFKEGGSIGVFGEEKLDGHVILIPLPSYF
ncbi:hypothetical protein DL96DRAFT_1506766 [Flagelloscypha sp. PMI_526]|nr:hypothetical protein DL96DRAFT_1506766 [Flagelloscypha sp. PMI_526]